MKNFSKKRPLDSDLDKLIKKRIVMLDGAMGTMIQQEKLEEADFRGDHFKNHPKELKGNNDLLCLTRPDIIKKIHKSYFDAGSDIVETNTFSATSISMADYNLEDIVPELNLRAAQIAREAADEAMPFGASPSWLSTSGSWLLSKFKSSGSGSCSRISISSLTTLRTSPTNALRSML